MNKSNFILISVFIGAIFFRFFSLGDTPAGIHPDEAAQGYNAFSLINTGKDMYGKAFPILFRANGSFQPPIYTYLATIPVSVLGNTAFAVRSVSAFMGVSLLAITFLMVKKFSGGTNKDKVNKALLAAVALSIAPWAIHFSRLAVEANLGVTIFALSIFFFLASLKNNSLFILACLLLGISTHAYYSERIVAILFLPAFVFIFKKQLLLNKNNLILGFIIFLLVMLPHLLLLKTGAATKRINQVSYVGSILSEDIPLPTKVSKLGTRFTEQYTNYYSPKNVFFDPETSAGRTASDLSVFYSVYIIPFLVGLAYLFRNLKNSLNKTLLLVFLIAPLPASITGDYFYPLRTLGLFWVMIPIIGFGLYLIWQYIKTKFAIIVFGITFAYLAFTFYVSYFAIFKYEEAKSFGYVYSELAKKLPEYNDKKVVLDLSNRSWGSGSRIAYLTKANPLEMQRRLSLYVGDNYYNSEANSNEINWVDNVEIKTIDWEETCQQNTIFIADPIAISSVQARDHLLNLELEITDLTGEAGLLVYVPSGEKKCAN